jgi:DNA-binding NarL/FixJ family response regulator
MKSIFVSSEAQLLPHWQQAFPQAVLRHQWPTQPDQARFDHNTVLWLEEPPADVVSTVVRSHPGAAVIVLSRHPHPAAALRCLRQGCRGYCHSLATPEMLQDVAEVVSHGGYWVGADLMQQGLQALREPLRDDDAVWRLFTPREKQIVGCILDGMNNKEICRHLQIEERTAKSHITAILKKAAVRDRLQLAARMYRRQTTSQPTTNS